MIRARAGSFALRCAVGLALAASASAAELTYRVEAGAGMSDNIDRNPAGSENVGIAILGAQFLGSERTRRLDANANVDLEYLKYLEDAGGDRNSGELLGIANAELRFGIVPEYFDWTLQDSFGQTIVEPFEPIAPGNRENINYASTGPDVYISLGSSLRARLFGRYSMTDYEERDLDGDTTTGGVSFIYPSSEQTSWSVNAMTSSYGFDDPTLDEYDRRSAFIRWATLGSRTEFTLDAGYNEIDSDEISRGRPLFRVDLTRSLSPSMMLTLRGSSSYSDAGEAFQAAIEQTPNRGAGTNTTPSANAFESRTYAVRWAFQRVRTEMSIDVSRTNDEYEGADDLLDRTTTGAIVTLARRFRPTLRAGVFADWRKDEFENAGVDDKERRYGFDVSWTFGRATEITFQYDNSRRDASANFRGFEENRVRLTLAYSPARIARRPGGGSVPHTQRDGQR
jgi:hypothetical protein